MPSYSGQKEKIPQSQSRGPSDTSPFPYVLWASHPGGSLGPRGHTHAALTPGKAGSSPGQACLGFHLPTPEVEDVPSRSLESYCFQGLGVPPTSNMLKFGNRTTLPVVIRHVL